MPRTIRFRYNQVFLPEYLSTILISIPISAVFMTTPLGGGRAALVANPHLAFAIAGYVVVALWLLGLTLLYRLRSAPVRFLSMGKNTAWIETRSRQIRSDQVVETRQWLAKFFGRLVRQTRIEDNRGNAIQFNDAMFHYDAVRTFLAQLLDRDLDQFPHDEPKLVERVQRLWHERHIMFPASETLGDVFSRLSWRGVCLLPVAVFDVLINLATILSLSKFQQHQLMVYSAPLSLLTSGLIARYVYYYMFSSTTMNKPLGIETAEPKQPSPR